MEVFYALLISGIGLREDSKMNAKRGFELNYQKQAGRELHTSAVCSCRHTCEAPISMMTGKVMLLTWVSGVTC